MSGLEKNPVLVARSRPGKEREHLGASPVGVASEGRTRSSSRLSATHPLRYSPEFVEYEFSEIEQKRGPEARTSGPWTLHTYSAYYDCPGARIDVSPALRITSMLSSALNSGVVLTARRCPRLAAANAAAPAVALSGAS
jgi:hypothetical protein